MNVKSLPYRVNYEKALQGTGALSSALYDVALAEAQNVLADLAAAKSFGTMELLGIVGRTDDLENLGKARQFLTAGTRDVLVLGIGGSSLGGQALSDLLPYGSERRPRVRFLDNLDPKTLSDALASCDPKTTRYVAISKSGGTAETLMQLLVCAEAATKAGVKLKDAFVVITELKPSALYSFGQTIGCEIVPHPLGIGGRYSVLSAVGLLPAMVMGLDAGAIRAGANAVVTQALSGAPAAEVPCAAGAALHMALSRSGRLRESVLWPYADKLKTFGPWWRQLWAESLGKGGQGSTPVAVLGPVDQHSQLQLFLDGPGGALFTIVTTDTAATGPQILRDEAEKYGVAYLGGHRVGDLVAAEARATAETLVRRGRPVREIHVPQIDERAMGALLMHFMLETVVMGRLMGVDPFDQPAVEEGKVLARSYLSSSSNR